MTLGRPGLDARIAAHALSRGTGPLARAWLARPRTRRPSVKVDVHYVGNRISFSQVYPYVRHAAELRRAYGAEIRLHPVEPLLAGATAPSAGSDIVLLQTWFTTKAEALEALLLKLKAAHPHAIFGFLDSFAHADLRLASVVDPHVDFYFKKSLFRDRDLYFRAFEGDTNLTERYGRLHGIAQDPVDWGVPRSILPKLRLSPNFFTAPSLLDAFLAGPEPSMGPRPIDVHARLATRGSPWYAAMRGDCLARVRALNDLRTETRTGVPWATYMDEMRRAKLCLSPFGYGEVCWRDVEAFLTGAVLVKPDMSHLETLPDLYVPGETYLPIRWDFEDLEDVVRTALADPDLRLRIAGTAFRRTHDYLSKARFVDDVRFLFDAARRRET